GDPARRHRHADPRQPPRAAVARDARADAQGGGHRGHGPVRHLAAAARLHPRADHPAHRTAGDRQDAVTADRLEHWLWVVRLTKTRSLAADAIKAGRVQVNGQPAKPSRDVRPGDEVELRTGAIRTTVTVKGAAPRRVGAAEAAKLYEETPE